MRAAILVAACFLVVSSTFAAEPQVQKVASVVGMKQVQKAPTAAKTAAPVRVWSVEMSCCEPQ